MTTRGYVTRGEQKSPIPPPRVHINAIGHIISQEHHSCASVTTKALGPARDE